MYRLLRPLRLVTPVARSLSDSPLRSTSRLKWSGYRYSSSNNQRNTYSKRFGWRSWSLVALGVICVAGAASYFFSKRSKEEGTPFTYSCREIFAPFERRKTQIGHLGHGMGCTLGSNINSI